MNRRLWKFGQRLPSDNKFQALLKLALLRKSLNTDELDVSEHNTMCRKCYTSWRDGFFTVVVIPGCRRARRQVEKLESKGDLTKQKLSLLKHIKTRVGRVAKYTCQICSYNTRIPLDARVKWTQNGFTKEPSTSPQASYQEWLKETQKIKKRRGKSNAGLKLPSKPKDSTVGSTAQATSVSKRTDKKTLKKFNPTDFRLIQQLLASSISTDGARK